MSTVTNFVFTWNNPVLDGWPGAESLWDPSKMKYLVFQLERGESGTHHFQGYCELLKRQRFQSAKKLISAQAHLESRKGTAAQARDYAMKEDTRIAGPWEFGEFSNSHQGKRNDLLEFYLAARSKRPRLEVADAYPKQYILYNKALTNIRQLATPEPRERRVYLLIGPPGSGKTSYVRRTYPDCFVTPVDGKGFWFDGYEDHDVALIDDFSGQWPLKSLLRILHEYPEKLPVKGAFVWWNPSKIFITTNEQFTTWYKRDDPGERESMLAAIARRITRTVYFPLQPGTSVED